MKIFFSIAVMLMLCSPRIVFATPAYEVLGLHIEMPFGVAVAQAEKLGGTCQLSASRKNDGAIYAHCQYRSCEEKTSADSCREQQKPTAEVAIAAQPVVQIGFEAFGSESKVTQIAISFEGSSDLVEAQLTQWFGEPERDGSSVTEKSWSNARRLHWARGNYHLGLHANAHIIMLTIDPQSAAARREG